MYNLDVEHYGHYLSTIAAKGLFINRTLATIIKFRDDIELWFKSFILKFEHYVARYFDRECYYRLGKHISNTILPHCLEYVRVLETAINTLIMWEGKLLSWLYFYVSEMTDYQHKAP
jgi:hypothetical protein